MEALTHDASKDEKAQVIDLGMFDVITKANEGIEFELKHPKTGAGLGVFLRVLGQDSETFRELQHANNDRRLEYMQKNGGKFKLNSREASEENLRLLAHCVTSWSTGNDPWTGKITIGGEELAPTLNNVLRLFTMNPAFKEQTDEVVGDRANFLAN